MLQSDLARLGRWLVTPQRTDSIHRQFSYALPCPLYRAGRVLGRAGACSSVLVFGVVHAGVCAVMIAAGCVR